MTTSLLLLLAALTSTYAQDYITPKFTATPKQQPITPVRYTLPRTTNEPPAQIIQQPITPARYTSPRTTNEPPTQIIPVTIQQPPMAGPGADRTEGYIRTELPGPQRLFMRESEGQFYDRIAQEAKKTPGATRAIFPEPPILTRESYQPRRFDGMPVVEVEPGYVCHKRLLFEQPNFERIGYNFGILQPAVGIGMFYYDLALMPYHAFSNLHDLGECSAGKCLPGDPAPLRLRTEHWSWTGAAAQTTTVVGLLYLFPR